MTSTKAQIPLEAEKVDALLKELEREESAKHEPISLTKTEFWQKMKRESDTRPTFDNLEKDGCDFIECTFIFMALLGVPEEAIELILCLMGMSRGEFKELIIATDEQIAKRMNCHRNTIKVKREILLSWMNASTYGLIEIHKRAFDPNTGKFKPTQYKLVLVTYIANFVRATRNKEFWKKPSNKILISAVEEGTQQVVKAIAKGMPVAQHTNNRKTLDRKFNSNNQPSFLPKPGSLRHAFKHESENPDLPLQARIKAAKRDAVKMLVQYFDLNFKAGRSFSAAMEDWKSAFEEIAAMYFSQDAEDLPDF